MEILRKLNTATTIYFPMIKAGSQDFAQGGDWTPVAVDTQYSIDGAAFGNTNSTPSHEGNGIWSLALLQGEVNGSVIAITVIDAATKAVEDQAIIISTYGATGAEHLFNWLIDTLWRRGLALIRASSDGEAVGTRNPLWMLSKLINRVHPSGSNIVITEEDDSTPYWSQAVTTDPGAEPTTEVNTN